jgi:hypothetical protein
VVRVIAKRVQVRLASSREVARFFPCDSQRIPPFRCAGRLAIARLGSRHTLARKLVDALLLAVSFAAECKRENELSRVNVPNQLPSLDKKFLAFRPETHRTHACVRRQFAAQFTQGLPQPPQRDVLPAQLKSSAYDDQVGKGQK